MSTLFQAKVATKALLEAWSWPTRSPAVRWAEPSKPAHWPASGELIYFFDSNITVPSESLRLGRSGYDEENVLRVTIDVLQDGDDPQTAETRMDELYDQLVLLFQTNPTLAGTVQRLEGWSARRQTVPFDEKKWLSRVTVEQQCTGVVTTIP